MKSFRPYYAEFLVQKDDEVETVSFTYWSNAPVGTKKNISDAGIECVNKFYNGDKKRPGVVKMLSSRKLNYKEYDELKESLNAKHEEES